MRGKEFLCVWATSVYEGTFVWTVGACWEKWKQTYIIQKNQVKKYQKDICIDILTNVEHFSTPSYGYLLWEVNKIKEKCQISIVYTKYLMQDVEKTIIESYLSTRRLSIQHCKYNQSSNISN